MIQNRLAYLTIKEDLNWISCGEIEKSLRQIYLQNFPKLKFFEFSLNDPDKWDHIIDDIIAFQPDVLVLADSRIKLHYWLEKISPRLLNCRYVIHTYGDIITRTDELAFVSRLLVGKELVVITPSTPHEIILKGFFNPPEAVVKIPFPLKQPLTLDVSRTIHAKLNLPLTTKVFIVASRISMDKNVHHVIQLFSKYFETDKNSALVICGSIDNQSTQNFNYNAEIFNQSFQQALDNNVPVFYLGHLLQTDLFELMDHSEALINLSTNIGEDFGLAASEALARNLRVILSNWGGHRDFRYHPQARLIDLKVEEDKIEIDEIQFWKALSEAKKETLSLTAPDIEGELVKLLQTNLPRHQGLTKKFFSYAKRLTFFSSTSSTKAFFSEFKDYVYPYWR